jgi:ABC-type branched-subunit amino acid transport system substrate-binding protein
MIGPRTPTGASTAVTAALTLLLAAALAASAAWGAGLSEREARGKEIFVRGESPDGREITAYVGQASVALPASAMPCANCHGADGLGRPEAGVIPSNITWSHLTKAYGLVSASGHRRHGPYDESSFGRAIVAGVDPADNALDPSMPRYHMSDADLGDLLAYVKRLESDFDPGLTADKIVVGTVVPRYGPMGGAGEAATAVLSAYFADLNARGGIYNRRLELVAARADSPSGAIERAGELLGSGEIFALVGPLTAGVDESFAALAEERKTPLIGPITQSPPADTGLRRYTFYIYAGPELQARALVEFAATRLPDPSIEAAVVHPSSEAGQALARAMTRQALDRGWTGMRAMEYPDGDMDPGALVRELQASGVQAVFFVGSGAEFAMLAGSADRLAWSPYLLALGYQVGREAVRAPARFDGRVFVAYPTSPGDQGAAGRREFGEFHQRHGLPRRHLSTQIAAYTAAKLLAEGLGKGGRALTREKLVRSLEGLYRYATGLTPPLTYGANRHVGAAGAHVVAVDLDKGSFAAGSTWVQPD